MSLIDDVRPDYEGLFHLWPDDEEITKREQRTFYAFCGNTGVGGCMLNAGKKVYQHAQGVVINDAKFSDVWCPHCGYALVWLEITPAGTVRIPWERKLGK